jgi:phasin family protein
MQVLKSANMANLDAMHSLAASTIAASERLAALNLDMARSLFESAAGWARPQHGDGLKEMLSSPGEALRPVSEKVASYFGSAYAIGAEVHAEVTELATVRAAEMSAAMLSLLDKAADSGPDGAAPAISAIRSIVTNAHSAYDSMLKSGRHVVESQTTVVAKAASALESAPAVRTKKAA